MNKTKFSLDKAIKAVEISSKIDGHVFVPETLSKEKSIPPKQALETTKRGEKEVKNSAADCIGNKAK